MKKALAWDGRPRFQSLPSAQPLVETPFAYRDRKEGRATPTAAEFAFNYVQEQEQERARERSRNRYKPPVGPRTGLGGAVCSLPA